MQSGGRVLGQEDRTDFPQVEQQAREAIGKADWRGALSLLMEAYGQGVYRFCLGMVRDPELAGDVQQTTFIQAYQALARYKGESLLRTWLYGIARYRCLDALKARRRRRARFEVVEKPPEPMAVPQQMEDHALRDRLQECLGKLAPQIRESVLLRHRDGFSYTEIARICGEHPKTLQARVARALPVLRRCLTSRGVTL